MQTDCALRLSINASQYKLAQFCGSCGCGSQASATRRITSTSHPQRRCSIMNKRLKKTLMLLEEKAK